MDTSLAHDSPLSYQHVLKCEVGEISDPGSSLSFASPPGAELATKNVFGEPFYGPIDDGLLEGLGAKPPPSASRTGRTIRRKVRTAAGRSSCLRACSRACHNRGCS
jgi:hypothetical protein